MYTKIKTDHEIESMRKAGKICSEVLKHLKKTVTASEGISTKELSLIAAKQIKSFGAEPSFFGYNGFPDVVCISINDEVVHGIPSSKKIVQSGDIISFDLGVTYGGMIVDSAISVLVGPHDKQKQKLLDTTEESLARGLRKVRGNCYVGDIGCAVQEILQKGDYGIVRDLVGHGVGHHVHEDPNIPNYGVPKSGPQLKSGMTIAVEPMATLGGEAIYLDSDGWTIRTEDGSLSAHFEQTVLITDNGFEILTPF